MKEFTRRYYGANSKKCKLSAKHLVAPLPLAAGSPLTTFPSCCAGEGAPIRSHKMPPPRHPGARPMC